MKLVRFDLRGSPHVGVVKGDGVVDISAAFPTVLSIIDGGKAALDEIEGLAATASAAIVLKDAKLLAPIERPGKYLAIGMNYQRHREESSRLGVDAPENHQLWFNKQTTCVVGPYDDITAGVSQMMDYEAELGVVIGKRAKGVHASHAMDYVFGYLVANDVSARDWQRHSPTFTMGKSFDTHGPIGPWVVTADEIADPHDLGVRCIVNGEMRQDSNTGKMIFNTWQQIEYLSTAFTLEPGDLIATGTPEGVGIGMQPPVFLKPGDVVRCEVDQIGAIENKVSAAS